MTTVSVPHSDVDLFADDVLTDPYPTFADLREAGPAVWLPTLDAWAFPRYAEVRRALNDHSTFVSGQGIAFNDLVNAATSTNIVATDPPVHDTLRNVLAARLAPRALRQLQAGIERQADELVDAVVGRGSFDAVRDLARPFPLGVVADLIGLPTEGRDEVLEWAEGAFNAAGPLNDRAELGLAQLQQQFTYIASFGTRNKLAAGSMGAAVYEAADRGEIDEAACMALMSAYLTAGMDTTINTIGHAVWLFAQYPDQWTRLREEPNLIPSAFNEVLRLESPVYTSGRVASTDYDAGGTSLPKGARVALLYGSANRDERKWTDPERFDVARDAADHVAFGYGIHSCAGQGLARLEAHGIFAALARRVEYFEAGEPVRKLNNTVRGLASLPVTVRRAVD